MRKDTFFGISCANVSRVKFGISFMTMPQIFKLALLNFIDDY